MNKDEALKLLQGGREGIIEWNRRVAGGDKIPSLHGVDLGKSDLIDTELQGACLVGANLAGADLGSATLAGADLNPSIIAQSPTTERPSMTAPCGRRRCIAGSAGLVACGGHFARRCS